MEKGNFSITTILLEEECEYELNGSSYPDGGVEHLKVSSCYEGWNRIRNEVKEPYICINNANEIPAVNSRQLDDLENGRIKMILLGKQLRYKWQMQYQNWYYGYDYKVMMSVLENDYPAYYKFAKKELVNSRLYFEFAGIFDKKDFDKIWDWICKILCKCEKRIPARRSPFQNKWRDHLAPFLFIIYVRYWKVRLKHSYSVANHLIKTENGTDVGSFAPEGDVSRGEIIKFLSGLISDGKVEMAVGYSLTRLQGRSDMEDVYNIFKDYEVQRQTYDLTSMDKVESLEKLIHDRNNIKTLTIKGKPKIIILEWNSFGHKTLVKAFERFGFECTCIGKADKPDVVEGEFIDEINECMSKEKFDVAYSTNYMDQFSQACYLHDIPYLAWNYDSPSYTNLYRNQKYPTTNIFCFDSSDMEAYKNAGAPNVYHLGLAVDIDHYDEMACSDEERAMYNAEISFVGQLYETKLTKAMGYLTDYKKAYLGALIDNQTYVYGYDFFQEVIIGETVNWLSHPKFNSIVDSEIGRGLSDSDSKIPVHPDSLKQLLNRQTTNKERLLLLILLAKHHNVKLYADKTSELFGDLKYCGRVNYYTQMPKVFKCSKINLNSTFRNIKNGIPLRCIDIMGCGGCLLTNYQRDFDEHFKDGENILIYHNAQEALEKADFYLAHDTLREKVALSGYETVKKYYSYEVKIKEMLELAGLEHIISACERNRGL